MSYTITGSWTNWTMFDVTRKYGTVQNLPYSQATKLIMAVPYRGETGKGQQRELVMAHVRKIKAEMEAGNFTPTPVSAALENRHREHLKLENEQFVLEVNPQDPLLHTDGGHRFEAISLVIKELKTKLEKTKKDTDKEKLQRWIDQAENMPCTVTVYFDGDPQRDFINLQAGRSVDSNHIKSLSLSTGKEENPAMALAFQAARLLHKNDNSPFFKSIKFDSRGSLPLPISTLTASGSSDIGTSLLGIAKLALAHGKDAKWICERVCEAYTILAEESESKDEGDGILAEGKVLTPIENNGLKGSSTMLTAMGMCLAYRVIVQKKQKVDEADKTHLIKAAYSTLNKSIRGNFAGPVKRELLGNFAKEFFSDLGVNCHQGVPVELLKTLSCSTFNCGPIPKVSALPDVDGPIDDVVDAVSTMPSSDFIQVAEVESETPIAAGADLAPWDNQ